MEQDILRLPSKTNTLIFVKSILEMQCHVKKGSVEQQGEEVLCQEKRGKCKRTKKKGKEEDCVYQKRGMVSQYNMLQLGVDILWKFKSARMKYG